MQAKISTVSFLPMKSPEPSFIHRIKSLIFPVHKLIFPLGRIRKVLFLKLFINDKYRRQREKNLSISIDDTLTLNYTFFLSPRVEAAKTLQTLRTMKISVKYHCQI